MRLWYEAPAEEWNQALPVGCGKLGAMVFGGVAAERIQMNEDSIWAGPPVPEAQPGAKEVIEEARALLFKGKFAEAQVLMQEEVMGERIAPRSYQPLGDLWIEQEGVADYEAYCRELVLETAITSTQWTAAKVRYVREVFATAVDRVIVCRIEASLPGTIFGRVAFRRLENAEWEASASDTMVISGQAGQGECHPGVRFCAALKAVVQGGTIADDGRELVISGADAITVLVSAVSDYNMDRPGDPLRYDLEATALETVEQAASRAYVDIRADHERHHREYFNRVR